MNVDVKESTPGTNVNAFATDGDLVDQLLQEDDVECQKWNFYNSFFFAFTAITTIGIKRRMRDRLERNQYVILYLKLFVTKPAVTHCVVGLLKRSPSYTIVL